MELLQDLAQLPEPLSSHQLRPLPLDRGGGTARLRDRPGCVVAVPPGVAHSWAAITDVRMTVTLEPALRADEFFEDLFALTNAGFVNAKGLPTPLHFAVLADDYRDLVYLAGAPAWLQKGAFAVLARLGRALGRGPAAVAGTWPGRPAPDYAGDSPDQ